MVDKVTVSRSVGKIFMSRRRFKSLLAFLHVEDPRTESARRGDPLWKVRSLVEHMTDRCQFLCQPDREISIDERMVKAKGHFQFRYKFTKFLLLPCKTDFQFCL